jgi:hypothetical protein
MKLNITGTLEEIQMELVKKFGVKDVVRATAEAVGTRGLMKYDTGDAMAGEVLLDNANIIRKAVRELR